MADGQCTLSEFLNDKFQFKCNYLKEYVIEFTLYFQIHKYIYVDNSIYICIWKSSKINLRGLMCIISECLNA